MALTEEQKYKIEKDEYHKYIQHNLQNISKLPKRLCSYCKKIFEPEFGRFNLRYCSDKCRDSAKAEINKKSREKNKEKYRLKSKEYYYNKIKEDPKARQKFTERSKKYREENFDKIKKSQQRYYQANKKAIQEKRREWWHKRGKKISEARKQGIKIDLLKRGRPQIKIKAID